PGAFQTRYGGGKFDATVVGFRQTDIASFTANAVVDGAGFQHPPSPGSVVSIFWDLPASPTFTADRVPLPSRFQQGEFSVNVGFRKDQTDVAQAPLLLVSDTQANIQISWEVDPSQGPVTMVVNVNGLEGPAIEIPIAEYSPGIFTFDFGGGRAVAINPDGTLAHPAGSFGAAPGSRPV
ncbi:MAG: hypothetical protein GY778_19120, partial [bacterium]|nr:hypothetical protein [bacterium]